MEKYNPKEEFEKYKAFISLQKEGLSEEVAEYLLERVDVCQFVKFDKKTKESSFKKRVGFFDHLSSFMEYKVKKTGTEMNAMLFLEQEIEPIAKSYRLFKPKNFFLFSPSGGLVKVFEYKPDKI